MLYSQSFVTAPIVRTFTRGFSSFDRLLQTLDPGVGAAKRAGSRPPRVGGWHAIRDRMRGVSSAGPVDALGWQAA
ncbi:MAG: hypothetical protein ACM32J_13080, partial [Rhizobacter sp.]